MRTIGADEDRHEPIGQFLYWTQGGHEAPRPGWTRDVSRSGLAFLTDGRDLPGIGHTVQVCAPGIPEIITYSVVRIRRRVGCLALFACRLQPGRGAPHHDWAPPGLLGSGSTAEPATRVPKGLRAQAGDRERVPHTGR